MSWLLIPVLAVWLTTNYLVATFKKPLWTQNQNVLGTTDAVPAEIENQNNLVWNKQAVVTLWFSQPSLSFYRNAYPLIKSQSLNAAISLSPQLIGKDNYMNWTQVKKLQSDGWEIASLPTTCDQTSATPSEVEIEVLSNKRELELRGIPTDIFDETCEINREVTQKYYLGSLSTKTGTNPLPLTNFYELKVISVNKDTNKDEIIKVIEQSKKSKQWIIFKFEDDQYDSLKDIVDTIKDEHYQIGLPSWVINSVR